LPRINQNGIINLSITINVNEFETTGSSTRTNRTLVTNVNLYDKDILVLGGLTKTKLEYTCNKTPLLGDIPLLGNLFRGKSKTVTKSHLMIFLRPEIIKPDDKKITHRFFNQAQTILEQGGDNFSTLKDPVSRWFLGADPKGTSAKVIEDFQGETESVTQHIELLHRNKIAMPEETDQDTFRVKQSVNDQNETKEPFALEQPNLEKPSLRAPIDVETQEKMHKKNSNVFLH
jgi:hypothetical protein